MACCAERITWLVLDAKNALPGKRRSMRGGGIKIIRGGETSSVRLPACIIIIIIIIILAHRPKTRGKQKMRHRHSGVPRWHRWAGPGDHRGRNMYVVSVHGDGGGGAAARSKAAERKSRMSWPRLVPVQRTGLYYFTYNTIRVDYVTDIIIKLPL